MSDIDNKISKFMESEEANMFWFEAQQLMGEVKTELTRLREENERLKKARRDLRYILERLVPYLEKELVDVPWGRLIPPHFLLEIEGILAKHKGGDK